MTICRRAPFRWIGRFARLRRSRCYPCCDRRSGETLPQDVLSERAEGTTKSLATLRPCPEIVPGEASAIDWPAIIDSVVPADEMPNVLHEELEQIGNYAIAKIKEAVHPASGVGPGSVATGAKWMPVMRNRACHHPPPDRKQYESDYALVDDTC
jgi:hypothetical protein